MSRTTTDGGDGGASVSLGSRVKSVGIRVRLAAAYIAYVSLAAGMLFCVAEIATRLFYGNRNTMWERSESEAYSHFEWRDRYFVDLAKAAVFELDYEPYSLWKHRPVDTETIHVVNGYRVSWEPPPDPDREERTIYVFGGSTLFGAEGPDELTIPSWIARKLNTADARNRFLVKSYGVSGFLNDNEVHLLVELLSAGHRPDSVVFYDGVNDSYYKVALAKPHCLYENFRSLGAYSLRGLVARLAGRSALLRTLMKESDRTRRQIQDPAVLEKNATAMLADYLGNVELVRSLSIHYGFDVHFFWQTNFFDTGKALTAEETRNGERFSSLAPAFEAVRTAMDRDDFFTTAGLHDLRDSVDGLEESVFLDFCHVTALGNESVATRMMRVLFPPRPGGPVSLQGGT